MWLAFLLLIEKILILKRTYKVKNNGEKNLKEINKNKVITIIKI